MPIYEFKCQECGFIDERIMKISEPYPKVCPSCGASSLQKIMSNTSFVLKGTGWYETDFKGSATNSNSSSKTENTSSSKGAKKEQSSKEVSSPKDKSSKTEKASSSEAST